MTLLKADNDTRKTRGINVWLVAAAGVLAASLISFLIVTNLAAPKSVYAADVSKIDNSVNHQNDATTSLNNFISFENNKIDNLSDDTQSQFDSTNGLIADANSSINQTQDDLSTVKTQVNNLKTQSDSLQNQATTLQAQTSGLATQATQLNTQLATVSQTATNTQTALTKLTATVSGLPAGLQITPSANTNSITLNINSSAAQTIAFEIEFRPTTDMPTSVATMDAALSALYVSPPVTLTAGSSAVRGDYTLYWDTTDSTYHVGQISFLTTGTALTVGLNSKTLNYVTSGQYEILITPVYITGTSTGSW
jgi:peptidoglycan hydrolase CwlO-like protein